MLGFEPISAVPLSALSAQGSNALSAGEDLVDEMGFTDILVDELWFGESY